MSDTPAEIPIGAGAEEVTGDPHAPSQPEQEGGAGAEDPKKPEVEAVDLFQLYKAEGNGFVKTEKFQEALLKYDLAWNESSNNDDRAMILNNKGVVAEKMGDTNKAVELFNEALALKPGYVKVLIRRALVHKKLKEFDEAFGDIADAYVLAIKSQQHIAGIQETIGSIIADCAETEIENMPDERKFMFPKDHFARGYFRQFYGDPFSRMWKGLDPSPLTELKDANGNISVPLSGYLAALDCMHKEKYSEIPGHCTAEIDNPEGKYRLEALLVRASFNFLCGYKEKAEADLKAVIGDPNASKQLKSTAYVKMAVVMSLWSTPQDTAAQFAEAEILWKENSDVYYHAALCLIDKGEALPAMALLEKGAELCSDPKQCPLLHILCSTIKTTQNGYCQNPTDMLGKLKQMESGGYFDCPECHEYYAQTLILFDDVDGAYLQFDKAANLSNGERIFELKKVMAKQIMSHEPEETIKCLEEFAEDPEVGNTAWYHIGEMNFILGNREAALKAFDKAIEKSSSVYDTKAKVLGKVDFKYNCVLAEKMKQHGLDMSPERDAFALE